MSERKHKLTWSNIERVIYCKNDACPFSLDAAEILEIVEGHSSCVEAKTREQESKLPLLDFVAHALYQQDADSEFVPKWLCLKDEVRQRYQRKAEEIYKRWALEETQAENNRVNRREVKR